MWSEELINFLNRIRETIRKMDPIITWSPWNPVAIKKVEPKAESDMQKGASIYSNAWNIVKIVPKIIVNVKALFAFLKFILIISWWDHVILTPEESRKIVFSNGILIGLKELIENGGHDCPNSIVGEILLWKKAQKKDTKNNTSEAINKIIPVFKPFITCIEWFPCVDPSKWMSRHHENATRRIIVNEIKDSFILILFIRTNPDKTIHKAPLEAKIGHGLMSTRWKGLNLFIII